jgi:hypothetical protein
MAAVKERHVVRYLTKNGDQIVRTKGAANTNMAAITDADAAKWVTVLSSMGSPSRPIDWSRHGASVG